MTDKEEIFINMMHELSYLENYDLTELGFSQEYIEKRKHDLRLCLRKMLNVSCDDITISV